MSSFLFNVAFPLAAPFWVLMIFAPTWSRTRRILGSPLVVVPPLVVYAVAVLPHFAEFAPVLARPDIGGVQQMLDTAGGAAAGWVHFIAFDLFVGRWIYLDGRERGVHPLIISPILVLTLMLGPLGLLAYLVARPASGLAADPAVLRHRDVHGRFPGLRPPM
jgi:Domain of unknown function (DUF4281)